MLPMRMCEDGLVRASVDEVLSVPLVHLATSLDDEVGAGTEACGTPTAISGYTEWVSMTEPTLSLGWDWHIQTGTEPAEWVRVGLPRSNVQLLASDGSDLSWDDNLALLATVVDALNWRDQIPPVVAARYAVPAIPPAAE